MAKKSKRKSSAVEPPEIPSLLEHGELRRLVFRRSPEGGLHMMSVEAVDSVGDASPSAQNPAPEGGPQVDRFYTLTPKGHRDRKWGFHLFEVLAVNKTHVMVRCMNPHGRITDKPMLLRRDDFTFVPADTIAAAMAEFGPARPMKAAETASREGPYIMGFGGWR